MARPKKQYGIMDENATKSKSINLRVTIKEFIEVSRLKLKTGLSISDLYRNAMKDYIKKMSSDE